MIRFFRGEGNLQQEEIDELRRRWEEDRSPRLALKLAEEYGHQGHASRAVEILEQALESHPSHIAAQVALGRYRLELGQAEAAAGVLEGVAAGDPTHLVANKLLVEAYTELGDLKRARDRLDLYTLLAGSDPEIVELERRLAEGAREPAAVPAAVAAAEPVPERTPEAVPAPEPRAEEPFGDLWADLGETDYWEKLSSEGIFDLAGEVAAPAAPAVAVEVAPPPPAAPEPAPVPAPAEPVAAPAVEPEATVTLGELYRAQGHREEAERIFRAVLERRPGDPEAARALGDLLRQSAWPLSAGELLGESGSDGPAAVLEAYRRRLRRARENDV